MLDDGPSGLCTANEENLDCWWTDHPTIISWTCNNVSIDFLQIEFGFLNWLLNLTIWKKLQWYACKYVSVRAGIDNYMINDYNTIAFNYVKLCSYIK